MPRALVLLLLSFSLRAAIWPTTLDAYKRAETGPISISDSDQRVWAEYGLEESERAQYTRPGRTTRVIVEAWRLKDSTSAIAASQWVRGLAPPGCLVHAQGNYVAVFLSGYLPSKSELEFWTNRLPGFRHGPAPSLTSFLPQQNRIAGRDRYILGPASLQAFLPAVGPPAAAFGPFQTEAQVAQYQVEGQEGPVTAAMFRFPTAVIARQQLPEFAKVPGVRLKRSGPTVVLALPAPGQSLSAESADRILKSVQFDIMFNYTDTTSTRMPDVGGMMIAIFQLTGLILLIAMGGGILVAGILMFSHRFKADGSNAAMTTLKLGG